MRSPTAKQMRKAAKAMNAARDALEPFVPSDPLDMGHSVNRLRRDLAEYADWLDGRAAAAERQSTAA